MKDAAIFRFFLLSSSAATIPVTLKTVNQDMGVKKDIASFVVPVGATINIGWDCNYAGYGNRFYRSDFRD